MVIQHEIERAQYP